MEGTVKLIDEFEKSNHQVFLRRITPRRSLTPLERSAVHSDLLTKCLSEIVSTDKEDVAEAISRLLPPGSNDALVVKKAWQEAKDCRMFEAVQEDRNVFCLHSSNSTDYDVSTIQKLVHFKESDVEKEYLAERNDYLGRAVNLLYIEPLDGFGRAELRQQLLLPLLGGAQIFVTKQALMAYHEFMFSQSLIPPRTICLEDFSELPTHWPSKTNGDIAVRVRSGRVCSSRRQLLDKRAQNLYNAKSLLERKSIYERDLQELQTDKEEHENAVENA